MRSQPVFVGTKRITCLFWFASRLHRSRAICRMLSFPREGSTLKSMEVNA